MRSKLSRWSRSIMLVAAATLISPIASAQSGDYPNRPLTMIIPNAPSGSTDLVGRTIADKLAVNLGQAVVVDNKPGAMGAVGLGALARANPDGYTLGLGSIGTIAINPIVNKSLNWHPIKDFEPISFVGSTPFALIVNASLPVSSVAELIALAKSNPKPLSYATGGVGGSQHLGMELLLQMADINMLHVPYKGSGPALIDLIGGHVDVMIEPAVSAASHVAAGKVKILALTGNEVSKSFPGVPLVSDTLPGYSISAWFALFTPARTDAAVTKRLGDEVKKVLAMPEVIKIFQDSGFTVEPSDPETLGKLLKSEVEKWESVVVKANIKTD